MLTMDNLGPIGLVSMMVAKAAGASKVAITGKHIIKIYQDYIIIIKISKSKPFWTHDYSSTIVSE